MGDLAVYLSMGVDLKEMAHVILKAGEFQDLWSARWRLGLANGIGPVQV